MYRFNVDPETFEIFTPLNDPIPEELQAIIIFPYRQIIQNDSFELIRLKFQEGIFIIHKYPNTPIYIDKVPYYFTLRCV